jgi:ferredoxin/flavodoxin---NADP+ reductase
MDFKKYGEYHRCKVVANDMISFTTAKLKILRFFSFKAGQCVSISVSNIIPPRIYNISSGEKDDCIEIIYKILPEGKLTPKLKKLSKGDYINVSKPFGKFLSSADPSWFIAAGIGITPFLSMINSGAGNTKKLIHGSRDISDFYFSDFLEKKLKENYIKCYTGVEKFSFFQGRISQYLHSLEDLPVNNKYYLCGSAEMVVDIRELLIGKGISFQNILAEIYF